MSFEKMASSTDVVENHPADPEAVWMSRRTVDGRKITYKLKVLQQPQRARACGSGAKSSADRRPVDPPPIVEMRIYEGEDPFHEPKKDITFAYNASFFLFATLEHARAIAPGKLPHGAQNCPVLTGSPVAGMAYLDRPQQAGYFIFPDLSVRHEGRYRLSFALFEEVKDARDMDAVIPDDGFEHHAHFRGEIKSESFIVFSAKKFPGLKESTSLSRTVAEQGCRVRIRRDVRMRRREDKPNRDYDDYEGDGQYNNRNRGTATPDNYAPPPGPSAALEGPDRPRSVSNASNSSFPARRRPSTEEMKQPYQSNNAYSSMPPPQPQGYSQMPQYNQSQNQYQTQYAPPAQPVHSMMQPPQAQYSQPQQPHSTYQSQNQMPVNPAYGYNMNHNYQQPQYEQHSQVRQDAPVNYSQSGDDYRRSSVQQPPQQYSAPNQMVSPYGQMDQYNRPQMNQQMQTMQGVSHMPQDPNSMHMPSAHSLAPLKLQPPASLAKHEPTSPVYQSPPHSLTTPMTATSDAHSYQNMHKYGVPPPAPVGQKRSFGSTFDTSHMNDRLQSGARPNLGGVYNDNYEEHDADGQQAMTYRRADGTKGQKPVPEAFAS